MRVNAVVSGQAGVALLVHDAELASLHAGRSGEVVRRRPAEARFLLGDAQDLQVLENVELEEVSRHLDLATAQVDALHVCLILLDGSLAQDTREEAAQELDDFLADPQILSFLERIFYSRPLPRDADLRGPHRFCTKGTKWRAFLGELGLFQSTIREVHLAWEAIPSTTFLTEENRATALSVAVREGLFRLLVLMRATDKSDGFHVVTPTLEAAQVSNSWEIVQAWTGPLRKRKETVRQQDFTHLQEELVAERVAAAILKKIRKRC